jgi:hypothetical protein
MPLDTRAGLVYRPRLGRSPRWEGTLMNAYLISIEDEKGAVVRLFEAAAARGVNIAPAYGLADGRTGLIAVGSDDEEGLRAAIADAGFTAKAVEMVVTEVDNVPGTGAALFRKLADAGVDLSIAVPVGMSGDRLQIGLGATDPGLLKRVLGV